MISELKCSGVPMIPEPKRNGVPMIADPKRRSDDIRAETTFRWWAEAQWRVDDTRAETTFRWNPIRSAMAFRWYPNRNTVPMIAEPKCRHAVWLAGRPLGARAPLGPGHAGPRRPGRSSTHKQSFNNHKHQHDVVKLWARAWPSRSDSGALRITSNPFPPRRLTSAYLHVNGISRKKICSLFRLNLGLFRHRDR